MPTTVAYLRIDSDIKTGAEEMADLAGVSLTKFTEALFAMTMQIEHPLIPAIRNAIATWRTLDGDDNGPA